MASLLALTRSLTESRIVFLFLVSIVRQGIWLFALAGLGLSFLLLAIGFAAQACYAVLLRTLSPDLAALAVAAGLLVFAMIVFFGFYLIVRAGPASRRLAVLSNDAAALAVSAASAAAPALEDLERGLARRAPSLAIISLCGGFLTGFVLLNRRR